MAHYVPAEQFEELTGALSKRKEEKIPQGHTMQKLTHLV